MAEKASSFSSFMSGTPMITVNRLKGSDNYQFWFAENGVEDHLTSTDSSVEEDKCPQHAITYVISMEVALYCCYSYSE